jgi:Subtilase family
MIRPENGENNSTEEWELPDLAGVLEYSVILKDHAELDQFYHNMESSMEWEHIPGKPFECVNRRPLSRATIYQMTAEEAAQISQDPRVLHVELNYEKYFPRQQHSWTQTSTRYSKSTSANATDLNWGLAKVLSNTRDENWGYQRTISKTASLICDASGKNVDIIIFDNAVPFYGTLEFAKKSNGTGYTRLVQYDWYQHDQAVLGSDTGRHYDYSVFEQNHSAHVTGVAAGNTQGWARDANIYHLDYTLDPLYVKEFHTNKPVNPVTGIKNPTIMNNSWGMMTNTVIMNLSTLSRVTYRGRDYFPIVSSKGIRTWSKTTMEILKIPYTLSTFNNQLASIKQFGIQSETVNQDFIDIMQSGVIVVCSAGNDYGYLDKSTGPDYNNKAYFTYAGTTTELYYHRGSSPQSADGGSERTRAISVGAMGGVDVIYPDYSGEFITTADVKSSFSNFGPRLDTYAPGTAVQSVYNYQPLYPGSAPSVDPRAVSLDPANNNFKKEPGTSIACPQVAGILACLAEKYPRIKQEDARAYLLKTGVTMQTTAGGMRDWTDLGFNYNSSSCRRTLSWTGTRTQPVRSQDNDIQKYNSTVFPSGKRKQRSNTGTAYPRSNQLSTRNFNKTYDLTVNKSAVTAGETFTVTLTTTNVPNGTEIPYIISAINGRTAGQLNQHVFTRADINVPVTGTLTVNNNTASIQISSTVTALAGKTQTINLRLNADPTPNVSVVVTY